MAIVAYYRMNGNSNDASGNGYNGTDANMTYGQSYGVLNGGASFNGSSSAISLGTLFSLPSALTISFLVNHDNWGGIYMSDYKAADAWAQWSVILNYNFSGLQFTWSNLSSPAVYTADPIITVGDLKWHHIVVIRDSSRNPSFFLDGKLLSGSFQLGSNATAVVANPQSIYIGRRSRTAAQAWYNGSMDEVKFQNTNMSNSWVKNEYSRIKGFFHQIM